MLTAIRDRASGWIAYVIIFLLSIVFGLWGINSFFEGGGDDRVAAIVNGEEIPVRDFIVQFQQQKRYIQSALGGTLPAQFSDDVIKGDVIRSMVQNELIRQQVDKSGFQAGDKILSREISEIPAFFVDGKFDANRYQVWLQSRGQSAAEFESRMREQLRISQFHDGIVNTSFVPPGEKKRFLQLDNQQREASYFTITEEADKYRDDITDEQILEFYENNSARFERPERVKVSYIEIDNKQIEERIDVSEESLKKLYEQEPERFTTEEQREARQILLKLPQGSPSSEQYNTEFAEKEKLVGELVERLRNGADFAELAGEYSEDSETAANGGQLGLLSEGDLEETLGEAIFSLKEGGISDPVATSLGIHIVEVEQIHPPALKPFDEVRDEIEKEYRQQEAERRYFDLASTVQNIAFEQPDSLQATSDATGLEIRHSDWFSRLSGQGIGQHDKVRQAAFTESVLQQGRNSEVVEVDDGVALVLDLEEHEAAQTKPLEEVRDEVLYILASQKASQRIKEEGSQALSRLRDGATMDELATELDAELQTPGFVSRKADTIPDDISNKLFTMSKPEGNKPVVDGLQLSNGNYVVIQLKSVKPGDSETTDTASQQTLDTNYGTREWQALAGALEANAEVKVLQESLDDL